MKKYVLLGVIALVILLAVPAAMASDTASLTTSGILDKNTIEVTVPWGSSFSMGQLVVDNDNYRLSDKGVRATVDGGTPGNWAVTAVAASSGPGWTLGKMNNGAAELGSFFQLYSYPDSAWQFIGDTRTFMTGSGATVGTDRFPEVQQPVTAADADGTYSIVITFTGMFTA
jgi:hypothetical protein